MGDEMICNVCKERVPVRLFDGYGDPFPVQHKRPDGKDNCHGFYVSGHEVKK